jgi:hypothetical protein
MKRIKQKLIVSVFVVLSLFILAGNSWSEINLPHANFNGLMQTYLDNGVDDELIFLYTNISSVVYLDGSSTGNPADDSIIGKTLTISGANRTNDYTFTDATLTITDGNVTYFSASLTNIEFVLINGLWRLNPDLDINNPSTMNLANISLDPGTPASQYILDLQTSLGSQTIAGMRMSLFTYAGDISGDGQSAILEGLLDGVPLITNNPPLADAGENITISSEEIDMTTIQGTATDADGDDLYCRWKEGANVLLDWTPVGISGECPLDLSTLSLGIGTYTLTLEVDDGLEKSEDQMILTIDNSAPHAAPGGGGVFEINTDVILVGDVSDYDGDLLDYEWSEGTNVLCSGDIQAIAEGFPVMLPDCVVSGLSIGLHTISLQADDGVNVPDSKDITVEVVDTTVPTLAPLASDYLLWPPNHIMIDIVIEANASDNSGLPVTLTAMVTSNEPEDGLGDGDTGPDWTVPVIDQSTGRIDLQLRRERSGTGNGRTYTVTITATDSSGNSSTTMVDIGVPHDMRNKKK